MIGFDFRRAVWGVALMSLGAFLLLVQFGVMPGWFWEFSWWGSLLVALGLLTMVTARNAESVGTGVTFTLLGIWILLVMNHLFGLRWYNSWPLALVSAGAGTVAHAIAANWLPDTEQKEKNRKESREAGHA